MIKRFSSKSRFEDIAGYDRALRVDDFVFVAGTTGFDYHKMEISNKLEDQVHQALSNLSNALISVNSCAAEVVRVRWIIQHRSYFPIAGGIIKEFFNPNRPPATTIVADLVDERMLFEIEATALIRSGD